MNIIPFDETFTCPKCGATADKIEYSDEYPGRKLRKGDVPLPERLACNCTRCGYFWLMHCRDHPEVDKA